MGIFPTKRRVDGKSGKDLRLFCDKKLTKGRGIEEGKMKMEDDVAPANIQSSIFHFQSSIFSCSRRGWSAPQYP